MYSRYITFSDHRPLKPKASVEIPYILRSLNLPYPPWGSTPDPGSRFARFLYGVRTRYTMSTSEARTGVWEEPPGTSRRHSLGKKVDEI